MIRDRPYLLHIRDAIARIRRYTADGKKSFLDSPMAQDATIRNLEIIGEAVKSLSPELRSANPDIPWAQIAGMRDVLVHNYMGVDLEIVWDVIRNRLDGLDARIGALLTQGPAGPTTP